MSVDGSACGHWSDRLHASMTVMSVMSVMSVKVLSKPSTPIVAAAMFCALLLSSCAALETEGTATATWILLDEAAVTAQTTKLQVGVTRLGCSAGQTGAVLNPQVRLEADQILIKIDVDKLPEGDYSCPGNDTVPLEVELGEPIRNRKVVDAACLDEEAGKTTVCSKDGVRWPS